jgi:hypothetical protein
MIKLLILNQLLNKKQFIKNTTTYGLKINQFKRTPSHFNR